MGETVKNKSNSRTRRDRPALTNEARQNQLIAKAWNLAEKQLDEGTASSQTINTFLKLGTIQAQAELEKLKLENELVKAKTEALRSAEHLEVLMKEAMKAFSVYSGSDEPSETDEEEYDEY